MPRRSSLSAGALLIGMWVASGCGQATTPSSPSSAPSVTLSSAPGGGTFAALSTSSITFITDTTTTGSEYVLGSFDGRILSFTNSKGTFTATIDGTTVFRDAQLTKFLPVDPMRPYAVDYNRAGALLDGPGILGAIGGMASIGGRARISATKIPNDPMKSFRPLPSF